MSLQMFDDICNLVNDYTSSPDVSMYTKLKKQKKFLKRMEETNHSHILRPKFGKVRLSDDRMVTVPVFDMK
jgi:hypothetical protein